VEFQQAIVKILAPDGSTAGTGFVVSAQGLLVTCAHVIQGEAAQRRGDPLPESAAIQFYATGDPGRAARLAEYWRGLPQDVAFLQMQGELPAGVEPLPLGAWSGAAESAWQSFGFPPANPAGLGAGGQLLTRTQRQGVEVLQLRSQELTNGFSGAPVWDGGRVIGMVDARMPPGASGDNWDTRFAIPAEALAAIHPALSLAAAPPPAVAPGVQQQTGAVHSGGVMAGVVIAQPGSQVSIGGQGPVAAAADYQPLPRPALGELPPPGLLPPGSRMPFFRNDVFTGREVDLLALARALFDERAGPLAVP
jgi:hypothetical protein